MINPVTFTFRETILAVTAIRLYKSHVAFKLDETNECDALEAKIMAAYQDDDDEV